MSLFKDCPTGLSEAFSSVKIGIVGAGGIGSNLAMLLVRSGADKLVVADFDRIEIQNLNRQFFFTDQLGELKVEALAHNLERIRSDISFEAHSARITPENACKLFADCNILVEAVDDAEVKSYLIEEWSSAFPDKIIIACSGIAGTSAIAGISTERVGNLSVIGDQHSTLDLGTFSARVMAAASAMAMEIHARLTGGKCDKCGGCSSSEISLKCDGREVALTGFPARMVENTVRGMVSSLKGADSTKSIVIKI
ncbi:MAG: sulfur carrier protein ThiS adenylyltransferase ThiF [bacterium]|nr:sulfur carrier protein ThiS adenylyltransferase ThiF [bacterium]